MKKFFIVTCIVVLGFLRSSLAFAQSNDVPDNVAGVPVGEIKKVFESPPNMLDTLLKKVQYLQPDTEVPAAENMTTTSEQLPDMFINPFVPQTPQQQEVLPAPTQDRPNIPVPEKPVLPVPQFTVSGLIWNTKKPEAIVNGQIVIIGDQVSSWSIEQITKEGVLVTYEDQNLWIKPIVDPNNRVQPNQNINPRSRR